MPVSTQHQEEKAELESILASDALSKSANLARLLQYICNVYFEGKAQDLKEYNIGVEALGRPPDFDPTANSIVRVEIHRLRERLKKYYELEGARDPIIVSLNPGSYVPLFIRRAELAPEQHSVVTAEATALGPANAQGTVVVAEPIRDQRLAKPRSRTVFSGRKGMFVSTAVVLAVAVVAWWRVKGRQHEAPIAAPAVASAGTAPELSSVRILAGYTKQNYIDRAGHVWSSDRYFTGDQVASLPRQFIYRTLDPTLFQNQRLGEFSYDIPLKPGTYELRLYFAELSFGPGTLWGGGEASRIFDVTMNGKPLLSGFDVFTDAGGNDTADVRVFKDVSPAPDGRLHLAFTHLSDQPMLNAIEIVPSLPGRLNPIRIVAQESCFTDSRGRLWNPDDYFSGGRLTLHKGPVENTLDPDLYDGERFGNFNYAIPVAPGKYVVTLHFAETYFGDQNPGKGGVGSRLFNVYCNGTTLLHDFDIFKEAGGADRAIAKSFRGLEPNAQGKLVLSFVPVQNYACINAIEVTSD